MLEDAQRPLWTPDPRRVAASGMVAFRDAANTRHGLSLRSYSELHAWSAVIDAGPLELRQAQDGIEVGFDFGEGFIMEFDFQAIVEDAVDFLGDVYDGELLRAGDINAGE